MPLSKRGRTLADDTLPLDVRRAIVKQICQEGVWREALRKIGEKKDATNLG